jgi:NH3-dependent NAD+ synthetase
MLQHRERKTSFHINRMKDKKKMNLDYKTNDLRDRTVLLSLSVDDIKRVAKDLGIKYKDIDIDNVFHRHRKYMEGDYVMEIFWNTLEDAVRESVK